MSVRNGIPTRRGAGSGTAAHRPVPAPRAGGRLARDGAAGRTAARRDGTEWAYETEGGLALAPRALPAEPARRRTAEERAAADERAAARAADRVTTHSRRRLGVAPPSPVVVARAPFIAMLIFIVVAGVVGILVLNTMITANQFRLNHLQSQQPALDQQEQQLRQALAQQESPGSLVAAARRLGLVPAGTLAYIQLPNGKVVGVPEPANSTPSVTDQSGQPTGTPSGPPSGGSPSVRPSTGG